VNAFYEMHFCTSYTQVLIQEEGENGSLESKEIICEPVGSNPNPIDLIAVQNDESGTLIVRPHR
jgi:hypothetical protein